jgi:hypothetical protein
MAYSEQDKREMSQRQLTVDIGQGTGNSMTNAVNLAIAKLSKEKGVLTTREDYIKEVRFFLDEIYKMSREKIKEELLREQSPKVEEKITPKKSQAMTEMGEEMRLRQQEIDAQAKADALFPEEEPLPIVELNDLN